jgi:hypothetical protein
MYLSLFLSIPDAVRVPLKGRDAAVPVGTDYSGGLGEGPSID